MVSDVSETASTDVGPRPKGRLVKIAVVSVAVVGVVVGLFVVYWWFFRTTQPPWLFEGAYAEYEGGGTILFVTVDLTMRLEVLDFNDTHAKLLTYMEMESDVTEPEEYQETMWVDLTESTYETEGYTLEKTYEDHVYIEGLGTRYCAIQEYSNEDMTMKFYVDKEIGWPLKMIIGMPDLDAEMELTLVETNIRELK